MRITSAAFHSDPPDFAKPKRHARRPRHFELGLKFEKRVTSFLFNTFKENFRANPWFSYTANNSVRERWCSPDGLLFFPKIETLLIVEVKLSHTRDAFVKLETIYAPICKRLFSDKVKNFKTLEVVNSLPMGLDQTDEYRLNLVTRFGTIPNTGFNYFNIMTWNSLQTAHVPSKLEQRICTTTEHPYAAP